jgi:hypothetical protein
MDTMEYNANEQFSKAQLTNLKLNNLKLIEALGLKINASRSPSMTLSAYQNL